MKMPRSNEITRTITTTTVTVMCVNEEESTTEDRTITLSGLVPQTNTGLLRYLRRRLPAPYRPALIRSVSSECWTYAMPETTFIALAEKRNPRTGLHAETEPEDNTENNEEE